MNPDTVAVTGEGGRCAGVIVGSLALLTAEAPGSRASRQRDPVRR
jgi:hypothetical protein